MQRAQLGVPGRSTVCSAKRLVATTIPQPAPSTQLAAGLASLPPLSRVLRHRCQARGPVRLEWQLFSCVQIGDRVQGFALVSAAATVRHTYKLLLLTALLCPEVKRNLQLFCVCMHST